MIAVVADESDHDVVREFFELFKTPWRFYVNGGREDVLLCASSTIPPSHARLVVLCGSASQPAATNASREQTVVAFEDHLFAKVRDLLTAGQPVAKAATPTLDLHIANLRRLILDHGIELTEIPPVPAGYNFVACLTHDIDHARLRYHPWHPALIGFLYRATLGSLFDLCTGRKSAAQVATNWKAALSLPFVFLGLARDFWDQFERFVALEGEVPSTFFFVPRRNHPGVKPDGTKRRNRAVKYALEDVADDIARLQAAGKEIGVHGIDAWRDSTAGRAELAAVQQRTNAKELGVRMHWLFFEQNTPARLDEAEFSYDSTVGYNNVIGYRAGTSQVFKPPQSRRLLELPLHVMDTALFYPSYMHLSEAQAGAAVAPLIKHAVQSGGALTVNWHDRSLAPERLWDRPYVRLIESLRSNGAWFATAGDAVAWFRKRRAAQFDVESENSGAVRVRVAQPPGDTTPALQLRTYRPADGRGSAIAFSDVVLRTGDELLVAA